MENIIKQWIDNPNRCYDDGVTLFVRFGGNRFQARYFENTQARFALKKLVYELGKLAKQGKGNIETPAQLPISQQLESNIQQPESNIQQPDQDNQGQKSNIPEVAAIAKGIVHDTWVELSRIKNELFDLGTENTPDIIARRKALLDEQAPLVARYNEVYEAKEAFFNGELDEQQLLAVINQEQPKEENKQQPKAKSDPAKLSDLELVKRIKNVKQVINRSNNQLLYQQNTVAKTENPMPDCPRRRDIEKRISVNKAELDTLTDIARQRGLIK